MTVIQGSATAEAAEKILKKAKPFAAEFLECDLSEIEFEDGIFRRVNTNKTISIEYLSKILFNNGEVHPFNLKHFYTTQGPSFPYGCHVVEVEIDKKTLVTVIKKYTVTDDVGEVINPDTLLGQIHGGIAQGVGQAGHRCQSENTSGFNVFGTCRRMRSNAVQPRNSDPSGMVRRSAQRIPENSGPDDPRHAMQFLFSVPSVSTCLQNSRRPRRLSLPDRATFYKPACLLQLLVRRLGAPCSVPLPEPVRAPRRRWVKQKARA